MFFYSYVPSTIMMIILLTFFLLFYDNNFLFFQIFHQHTDFLERGLFNLNRFCTTRLYVLTEKLRVGWR